MYCRACQYELASLRDTVCPECGRPFDPSDPRTFARRRRGPQALIGWGLALAIGVAMILAFRVALIPDYGYSRHAAFLTIFGIGLCLGVAAAVLAACNRSWWGRVPLLLIGILCVWLGLFLGSDHGFRVWQSMPDPPDEAFADTAPLGALLAGWLPGAILVGVAFAAALLTNGMLRRLRDRKTPTHDRRATGSP